MLNVDEKAMAYCLIEALFCGRAAEPAHLSELPSDEA